MELIIPALACLSLYLLWRIYLESTRPRIPAEQAIPLILEALRKNQERRSKLYAVIGVFAVEGLRLAVYLWAGGGDVRELTEIFRTIAGNPSAVKDLLPILPTLALVWLIYRMHQQNDRNFREVIKVIRDVGKVINENTSALDRVNEREDEADRRKRH